MSRSPRWALLAPCLVAACFNPTSSPASSDTESDGDSSGSPDSMSSTSLTTNADSNDGPSSTAPSSSTSSDPDDDSGSDSDDTDASTTGPSTTSPTTDPATTDPTDTDPTTDDDSSTGDAACDGQCAPEVPQGWQGPVVVHDGEAAPPACPGTYPQAVHTDQHVGLDSGGASCSCECGNVVGASCGAATMREEGNMCVQFIIDANTFVLQPNQCDFVSAPADTYSVTPPALATNGASCSPNADENIPAPTWDRNVRSCQTAPGDACDGGTCFPPVPEDHAMCIYVAGEAACPGGMWSNQVVTHSDYSDDRDCSACTCGTPSGTCGGSVTLMNQGCGIIFVDEIVANGCATVGAASHAEWSPVVNAACNPSGGALVGDAEPTGAITYCCL